MTKTPPRQTGQPTEAEMQARIEWFEASRREADRISHQAKLDQEEARAAEFKAQLINSTGFTESTLIALREWLKHNP